VWLWIFTILVAWAIFYWRKTQGEIESQKAGLLARQRGVVHELAPKVDPVLKRVEDWTVAAAGPYADDMVDPVLKTWDFAGLPGIYLRVRVSDAADATRMRRAANDSLRDGFTACLFHEPNPDPASGPPCRATRDCAAGTFCNEVDHCTAPAQPYNMRAAYRGARVLSEEWTVYLRTASDDMRMRLAEREFDGMVKDDIPLVIDLLTRAQFYLLVLDEPPAEAGPSGRRAKPTLEEIQGVAHMARVFLFGLKGPVENKPLLRLRRMVDARLIPAGEVATTDPRVLEAQQRQANSCQLALAVREALSTL